MPGQLKEVRSRIKSVISTQQITKAMKLVSAAKFKKAQDAIVQMRPYALKLNQLLQNISASATSETAATFSEQRQERKVLLVIITSDKGLAGAFNTNLIKMLRQRLLHYANAEVTVMTVGKKGYDAFRKQPRMIRDFLAYGSKPRFDQAAEAAQYILDAFEQKTYDKVEVIYSRFRNAASQVFTTEQFLPVVTEQDPAKAQNTSSQRVQQFIFEPDQETLVKVLVPKILKTQFFRYLLESNASEHGARMTAMDKASDNANEILRELRIQYNRARQAAITTELTEIVSGAAALKGA
jgi:F-type H+-transporting ATPase subunit gamma